MSCLLFWEAEEQGKNLITEPLMASLEARGPSESAKAKASFALSMRFSGVGGAGSPGDRDALVEPGRRSSEMPGPGCRSSVLGQVTQRIRLVSIARRQDPQEPPFQLLGAATLYTKADKEGGRGSSEVCENRPEQDEHFL